MNNSAEASELSEIAHTQHTSMGANFVQEDQNQNSAGNTSSSRRYSESDRCMYRAVLSNDWSRAEILLKRESRLAYDIITERGDRPLHLSIAMKHKKFAHKLIDYLTEGALELRDGSGYTALCYAAISAEMVDIAQLLKSKCPALLALRNKENMIPLQTAISGGKYPMILFLFKHTLHKHLSQQEWFSMMMSAIATKMYDLAVLILERDGTLATMRTQEGTALHLLARQELSEASTSKTAVLLKSILGTTFYGRQIYGEMEADARHLAKELLFKIGDELKDESSAVELLQNPPILHDAAKVGNVELIVKISRAYPDLLWRCDRNRHTIFHIAVMYRQDNVFSLIRQIGGLKNVVVMEIDDFENNILHLAAKRGPRNNIVSIPALQMQTELAWFKEVEAIVPITLIEKQNRAGKKPRELFSEEHAELLRESETWMRSTADSCMLIATIILTVVYAAAFTVPGGTNGETGLPILMRSNWFNCFFVFEALALFGSTLCIITFWSITSSGFREERFLDILPYQLKLGLSGLFGSLIGAISAFMSAYCLVLVDEKAWVVKSVILLIYVMLVLAICGRFTELWFKMSLPKYLPRMLSNRNTQTLFTDHHRTFRI